MHCHAFFLTFTLMTGCAAAQQSQPESLSVSFKKVSSAVVVVMTKQREVTARPAKDRSERFVDVGGLGSGVLVRVDEELLVFTAAHVVQAADAVVVKFQDGRTIPAKVKSSAPLADVALLELETTPQDVKPAALGDSDLVAVGDPVFVVGAPFGLSHTLTAGYVGARRDSSQTIGALAEVELFQTDAAINTGNSGGPLCNSRGEIIGIVSHILSRSGGFEGIGFAITSNVTKKMLLDDARFWSGFEAYILEDELCEIFNVPQDAGLLVQRVAKNSPAERLGLRPGTIKAKIASVELLVGGDIILSFEGIPVDPKLSNYDRIRNSLEEMTPDHLVKVEVLRQGKVVELSQRRGDL